MGGPFVKLSFGIFDFDECDSCFISQYDELLPGFYGRFTSSWLKSKSNNDDLFYATLHRSDGSTRKLEASFDYCWAGTYELGYHFCDNYHVSAAYFGYKDDSSTATIAGAGEHITSIDSSGVVIVQYTAASSKVEYDLDQVEIKIGNTFSPSCRTLLQLDFGVRYANLERIMHNRYEGGDPSTNFETKNGVLKSKFHGTGPVFSAAPTFNIYDNFDVHLGVSTAFLIGHIKSTLDQNNNGSVGDSSNTLSTPWTQANVPVVDLHAGLRYNYCFAFGMTLELEAGYQFTDYFRVINLVYPVFRTGLEQINSDLKLHGPYISLRLANY